MPALRVPAILSRFFIASTLLFPGWEDYALPLNVEINTDSLRQTIRVTGASDCK